VERPRSTTASPAEPNTASSAPKHSGTKHYSTGSLDDPDHLPPGEPPFLVVSRI
jgi:hypothetical protein